MKRRAFFKAGLSLGAISLLEPLKGANLLSSSFEGVTSGPIVLSTWMTRIDKYMLTKNNALSSK